MKIVKTKYLLLHTFILAFYTLSFAQSFRNAYHTTDRAIKINPIFITSDFSPVLQNLEAPVPGGKTYASFLLQQKQNLKPLSVGSKKKSVQQNAEKPLVLTGFEGNLFDGSVPLDNDLAISNNNMLVSVANSTIYMYDMNLDTLVKNISLEAFADTLGLSGNMYDPRIIYDPKQDRFIMVWLSGSSSDNSHIVLCFSETNNPLDHWYLYALPGNPLSDSSWTDYPQIAITDEELFITANLLQDKIPNDNRPDAWKYYFRQSIIWQINKADGFAGDSLKTKLYSNIFFQGIPVRYISPMHGGSTTYGPDIYFVSNKPFDLINDTFFVMQITGTLDNPASQLILEVLTSDLPYGIPPDAKQRNNHFLLTNDARILDGYFENNTIHFVMNCVHTDTLRAAIYHGIIKNVSGTKSLSGHIIGSEILDYGYPNISYTGKHAGDDEAIISFNHTSTDTFAGVSAVFFDGNTQQYSDRISLKTGDSFINVLAGNYERWGDYSGSQRKYNEPGVVWIAGFFGSRRRVAGPVYSLANYTWIAALQSPDTSSMAFVKEKKHARNIKAYPNPSDNIINVSFELHHDTMISIELLDASGKKVKTLLHDIAKNGRNVFQFSTNPLAAGTYRMVISDHNSIIFTGNIIKQ
jgi:hypothetical protein